METDPHSPAPSQLIEPVRRSRLAIAALLLGWISLLSGGLLFFLPLILGHLSRRQIKRADGALSGESAASTGIELGYVSVIFLCCIVACLMAMQPAVPGYNARTDVTRSKISNLENAIKLYEIQEGKKPETLRTLIQAGYLKEFPKDSWGNPFHYENAQGEIWTFNPDGDKITNLDTP